MRLVIGLLRILFFVIPMMVVLLVVAAFALVAGTLFFMLSGRRPRFQVRTTAWPGPRAREPMKDVTPHTEEPERQLYQNLN